MIIVCANCGQNMDGTPDLLHTEVRCPNCMEWTYPCLPKAGVSAPDLLGAIRPAIPESPGARPELMGGVRLDELVGANEESEARHDRRGHRKRRKKPQEGLWYVMTDSGPKGPYAHTQIIDFARCGKINQANQLQNASSGIEYRAGEIPNLFPTSKKTAPKEPPTSPTPQTSTEWYVQTAKGAAGPFTNIQIIAFTKSGKINAGTMLRKGHVGDFIPAKSIRGLFPKTN